ncbi:hypothetical protein GCM10027187_70790 [Streptosporangium sandarakinum]
MSRPFSGRLTRVSFRVARGGWERPEGRVRRAPRLYDPGHLGEEPRDGPGRPGKPRVPGEGPREKTDV